MTSSLAMLVTAQLVGVAPRGCRNKEKKRIELFASWDRRLGTTVLTPDPSPRIHSPGSKTTGFYSHCNNILKKTEHTMNPHDLAVSRIAATVRGFFARREAFRVNHGSTNSTRPAHTSQVLDISMLNNVIEIIQDSQSAVVEPNVPMDKLVHATLARGMVPPVVMEFPGITVGGGFAGSAGESSSFRYGYFD